MVAVIVKTPDPFVVREWVTFDAPPVVVFTTRGITSYAVELLKPPIVSVSPPEAALPKNQVSVVPPIQRIASTSKSLLPAAVPSTVTVTGEVPESGVVALNEVL